MKTANFGHKCIKSSSFLKQIKYVVRHMWLFLVEFVMYYFHLAMYNQLVPNGETACFMQNAMWTRFYNNASVNIIASSVMPAEFVNELEKGK